jgi:hypothetical protein
MKFTIFLLITAYILLNSLVVNKMALFYLHNIPGCNSVTDPEFPVKLEKMHNHVHYGTLAPLGLTPAEFDELRGILINTSNLFKCISGHKIFNSRLEVPAQRRQPQLYTRLSRHNAGLVKAAGCQPIKAVWMGRYFTE